MRFKCRGTSVNRYLIDGIAKAGSGEAFVVTEPSQASDTARDFSTYIQSPVMTGINVSFDGFDVYDVEPDILPTLFAQLQQLRHQNYFERIASSLLLIRY